MLPTQQMHHAMRVMQILNAYQPPSRPTAQDVISRLPRVRVRPAAAAAAAAADSPAPSNAGAGPTSAAAPAPPADSEAASAPPTTSPSTLPHQEGAAGAVDDGAAGSDASGGERCASCQPGEPCSVCHDPMAPGSMVVELPCAHCYHEACLMPWLEMVSVCCRYCCLYCGRMWPHAHHAPFCGLIGAALRLLVTSV